MSDPDTGTMTDLGRRHRELIILVVTVTVAMALAAALGLAWARNAHQRDFEARAQALGERLEQQLQTASSLLVVLSTLYQRDDQLDPASLGLLARDMIESTPWIELFTYQPLLEGKSIPQLQEEMYELGLPQFRITRYDSHAHRPAPIIPVTPNDHHLPIVTLEPLTPAMTRYYGLDLLTLPDLADLPQRLARENTPLTLLPEWFLDYPNPLLLVQPTFAGNLPPTGTAERARQLRGVLIFVLQPDHMLQQVQTGHSDLQTALRARPDGRLLAESIPSEAGETGPWGGLSAFEKSFPLAGTPLELVVRKPAGIGAAALNLVLLFMLLSGGLAATLFTAWRNHRHNLRARAAAEARINEERQRAEITLRAISDAVITTDLGLRILAANPAAGRLCGVDTDSMLGQPLFEVVRLLDEETELAVEHLHELLERIDGEDPGATDLLLEHPRSGRLAVHVSLTQYTDPFGNAAGFVLVLRDVSTERSLTRELTYQATHDALTGLYNRYAFENELSAALHSAREHGRQHMLCYLDLDQFKLINDTCGHIAGDQVLKQLAGILQGQLREHDVLARLGGDEFGILLPNCPVEQAREVAERLREAVREYRFRWEGKLFDLRASIGVVPITADTGSLTDLLAAADIACYAAKERGRDNVYLFSPEDRALRERHGQMQWLPVIQSALHENRFNLLLQPIEPILDRRLPWLHEFLVRLRQAGEHDSLPGSFIPAAERYDLMKEIDRWVIDHALSWIAKQPDHHSDLFSINLSGQSLGDRDMADYIIDRAQQHGVPFTRLCFEITETAAITNFNEAMTLIIRLRQAGGHFALDDFGSGLSSFAYLKQMPLDFIKIDGQFVRDITSDRMDATIVRAIQDIAHTLGVRSIAEFVEDAATRDRLIEMGIDYAQGWYIGHPRPLEEIDLGATPGDHRNLGV